MPDGTKRKDVKLLPLLPLRGLVVFPFMILHFDVGRAKSIKALEEAMINDQMIFLSAQKEANEETPGTDDIYDVGTIAKVKQLLKLPGDTIRVLVEGISRAKIVKFEQEEPFFKVSVIEYNSTASVKNKTELEALVRQVNTHFEQYARLTNRISPETILSISSIRDYVRLSDVIASNMFLKVEIKQQILKERSMKKRLEKLLDILVKEINILEIERNINIKVRQQIEKTQKEYYLKEQLKVIRNELGEDDIFNEEIEDYKDKIVEARLPDEVEKKVLKELDRLKKMHPSSAEGSVIRNYLDWIISLPWNKTTKEILELPLARDILDKDHYGLNKVKERIIEFLAIRKLRNGLNGPILCLVGPPGVGKTSIARSIARALNRKYIRMSLGGIKDESEIRGHRRTYIGAMPGRIISAIKQAGTKNPLLLLDEVDKMSSDFRGDPASAMLEVLDSEQNNSFRDHYLDVPFDLSNVIFLTTANNKERIPRPLLDRMEIIELSGYTEEEKYYIAKDYLIPKQLKEHGLKSKFLKFNEQAIRDIINYYTREAGVRELERQIASVCRKVARLIVEGKKKYVRITPRTLTEYLGGKKYLYDKINEVDEVGVARGLAWTPVGGDTISIEVNLMNGDGKLELTGRLGEVMKESAYIARSYVRSVADFFGIDSLFYKNTDMHIHVPEGAVPKDGPSAGITIATAMISALTGIPVKRSVAMTGEITLRGKVLPIGGLKEKAMAACRAGVKTIVIPLKNKKDIEEIPEKVRNSLKIVLTNDMELVLKTAMVKMPARKKGDSQKKDFFIAAPDSKAREQAATTIEQ